MATDEWPSSVDTTSIGTPSRSHRVAALCLNQWGSKGITVDPAVLLMQVVGIEPDQLRPGGDRPAAGLGSRPVRVLPWHDADLLLGRGDVLMTEAQGFPRATAAVIKQGKEEAVPQPGARIENRLRLGGSQDPRQLLRGPQRDRPAAIRLPLADMVQERLHPPRPPAFHAASRSPTSAPLRAWCA